MLAHTARRITHALLQRSRRELKPLAMSLEVPVSELLVFLKTDYIGWEIRSQDPIRLAPAIACLNMAPTTFKRLARTACLAKLVLAKSEQELAPLAALLEVSVVELINFFTIQYVANFFYRIDAFYLRLLIDQEGITDTDVENYLSAVLKEHQADTLSAVY